MNRAAAHLLSQVESLLADPAHTGHPLEAALRQLYEHHLVEMQRLERMVAISDQYQRYMREDELIARRQYLKALRRQEKLSRISDGYQRLVRDHNLALKLDSTHDQLTGLPNRRLLDERLPSMAAQRRYTLAMLDIDHFKSINDLHGHEVGDKVLVAIAEAIRQELRDYDLCARWGGEEFLLLLANTQLVDAQAIVDRLRQSLASMPIAVNDATLYITASAGLSEYREGEDLLEQTLLRADHALLEAKRNGRDRSCVAA